MINKSRARLSLLALILTLCACTTETVEVTRIKILERRVIERVLVTVEVTRIQRVVETPKPTAADIIPLATSATVEPAPVPPTATATTAPRPTSAATTTPVTAKREAESLLAALTNMEQSLLSLVQALNSDPLPIDSTIELFNSLGSAPTFSIPESEVELQSIYLRYREQLDRVAAQGSDLYTHLVQIQSGQADHTEVSPIHLSLAQDAASAATSTIQALIRDLETYLNSQP